MAVAVCGLGPGIVDRGSRGEAGATDSCLQRAEEDGTAKVEHGVGSVVLHSKAADPQPGMCIRCSEEAPLEDADAGHGKLAAHMAGGCPLEAMRGDGSCTMVKSDGEPGILQLAAAVAHCERCV